MIHDNIGHCREIFEITNRMDHPTETRPTMVSVAAAGMNPLVNSSTRNVLRVEHIPVTASNNHNICSSSTLNSAIAGYLAGLSGTVVGYPLDSAKVWIQTGGCKNMHMIMASNRIATSKVLVPSTAGTVQSPSRPCFAAWQTLRALYSGVSGPLVTVGMVQSLNFAVYDRTRQFFHLQRIQQEHLCNKSPSAYLTEDSLSGVATAGFVSGLTIACVTAPLVMIKTNQQVTGNSFRQALRDAWYRHGRLNLSAGAAGFVPHVLGESLGRSIYYFTYEGLKRSWAVTKAGNVGRNPPPNNSANISLQERMACAAASGIICWAAIFPLDSLQSRLYAAAGVPHDGYALMHSPRDSMSSKQLLVDTLRQMQEERSFYRGFWVTVLRAGPVAAVVLPVYDLTLETLSSRLSST
jgi:solute carrier family 25 (mitochondrial carnitine/acylcarnitine transporter), member 20/29